MLARRDIEVLPFVGSLSAPDTVVGGTAFEVEWTGRYVSATEDEAMLARPITVSSPQVTLAAPDSVKIGTQFNVTWTGPNGPGDYITIVPDGAAPGTYLSYAYTRSGSPVVLTAPAQSGNYEIRYTTERAGAANMIFASIPITVRP